MKCSIFHCTKKANGNYYVGKSYGEEVTLNLCKEHGKIYKLKEKFKNGK